MDSCVDDRRALVGLECRPHRGDGAMQPRPEGGDGDLEDVRRLGVPHAEVVMEDDHDPLLRRQALEASVELVTHGHGALGVGRRRLQRRVEGELDDRPLSAPFRGAVAGTDEQPMQPGVEPVRVTQTA